MTTASETDEAITTESAAEPTTPGMLTGLGLLAPFARDGWHRYAIASVLAVAGTACQLGTYYVIYRVVRLVVEPDGVTSSDMYRWAILAVALVVAQQLLMAMSSWISHRAAFATLERLRLRIGERLGKVPLGFLTRRRSGEIQRTVSDDVEKLELFLAHAIPDVVSALAVVAISTIWMVLVDWRLALATVAVVLLALPIMSSGMRKGMSRMEAYTVAMSRMNGSITELVRGLPVIRMFNQTDQTFAETRSAVEDAARFQSMWGRDFLPSFSLFYVLVAGNILFIMPVGVWLWTTDRVTTSTLLFFFIVGAGYSVPIMRLLEFFAQLNHLTFGAQAVIDLNEAGELDEAATRSELGSPSIEVNGVSFSHVGVDGSMRQVLLDCNFVAQPGTVTALVGPSGAGKSTLAKLLCRFWDVDSGSIQICGHDVRDLPLDQVMEQVSFVFQETFLFDETAAANIRFGRPGATDAEVEEAARAARAHEFITRLPDGYGTRLGERGARLSGGEQQRMTLARAFLKGAPIVVLDEATAFADPENEAAIQDAIAQLIEGRTVIMIAHRLSTIVGADQILVLDAPDGEPGTIVERGNHDELVELDGLYSRMWSAFEATEMISLGDAVRGEGEAT